MDKKNSPKDWGFIIVCGIITIAIGGVLCVSLNSMFQEHTKTGTIERVEIISGHFGSTMDKTVVAFSDGTTIILDIDSFGEMNKYLGKTVTITYSNYHLIKVIEV